MKGFTVSSQSLHQQPRCPEPAWDGGCGGCPRACLPCGLGIRLAAAARAAVAVAGRPCGRVMRQERPLAGLGRARHAAPPRGTVSLLRPLAPSPRLALPLLLRPSAAALPRNSAEQVPGEPARRPADPSLQRPRRRCCRNRNWRCDGPGLPGPGPRGQPPPLPPPLLCRASSRILQRKLAGGSESPRRPRAPGKPPAATFSSETLRVPSLARSPWDRRALHHQLHRWPREGGSERRGARAPHAAGRGLETRTGVRGRPARRCKTHSSSC